MTLYEIDMDLQLALVEAEKHAAEHAGEIPEETAQRLDELSMERERKLINIGRFLKNLRADIGALEHEETALASRRKALERKAEWLKGYASYHIKHGEKITDPTCELSLRKS